MDWTEGRIIYVSANMYVKSVKGQPVGIKTGEPTPEEINTAMEHCCVDSLKWEEE